MTVKEIREKAKEMGVKPGRLNKTQLIRAIQTQEGNYPCFQTALDTCDQEACCWREDCLTM